MSAPELEYVSRDFVNFDDRSYRWVDIKRFRVPEGLSRDEALALLLGHVRYQDHYTSADSHERPTGNLHGPYLLDHIGPASFVQVDEETALTTIRDFAADDGEMGPKVLAALDHDVYSAVRAMPVRYRLKDLGTHAHHEFGSVLHDFHELVLLDPPPGSSCSSSRPSTRHRRPLSPSDSSAIRASERSAVRACVVGARARGGHDPRVTRGEGNGLAWRFPSNGP